MNTFLTGAALSVTRWWTRDYTIGTPHSFARARRAEIDADLWEFERDLRQTAGGATTTWARLLLGVPDDLSWRLEHGVRGRAVLWSGPAMLVLLVSVFWLVSSVQARDVPLPPPPSLFVNVAPRLPPSPPPPPRRPRS